MYCDQVSWQRDALNHVAHSTISLDGRFKLGKMHAPQRQLKSGHHPMLGILTKLRVMSSNGQDTIAICHVSE